MTPRTILLDGDTIIYEACRGNEFEARWDPTLWTLHCNEEDVIEQFRNDVEKLRDGLNADRVVVTLSDYASPRWRNAVMPTYKANRDDTRKPLAFEPLRSWVFANYETKLKPGLEGDDLLGIMMTMPRWVGDRICVSIDKDLKTLPGMHLNYTEARSVDFPLTKVFTVTPSQANAWHLMQTLMGDRVDGYPGCPGVGEVRAERLLAPAWITDDSGGQFFHDNIAWQIVVAAYEKAGLNEVVALQNARVARILRNDEWDKKKQQPILWTPPKEG